MMKSLTASTVAAAFLLSAGTYANDPSLLKRALPNAPDGYAPAERDCPSERPSVRNAADISSNERQWLKQRREKTTDALIDFFGHAPVTDFDAVSYITDNRANISSLPNIGIAVSGGGYRALMNGAGAVKAFDSRTQDSTNEGHLGGLLQSATYLSGLSGGGWLVGSMYTNNYSTVATLQQEGDSDSLWEFGESILEGPEESGIGLLNSASYYSQVMEAVNNKRDAGYEISITDLWGRMLSYQLINGTEGGVDYTFSSIRDMEGFSKGDMPMPILVADGRNPGEKLITTNATVFEFNPYEFGTFDPTVFGFVPTEFLGSAFSNGELPRDESCIRGFDNAGYIMGTSSSLFNQFALQLDTVDLPSFITDIVSDILGSIGDDNNDIAEYKPNPFYHYSSSSSDSDSPFANRESLTLVDGGEDLQNIPLHPLLQPERHVDVIFAVDSSADNDFSWPNGTALVASYERSTNEVISNGTGFPAIPDQNTFVNKGLNAKPTFFGCDSSNLTHASTPIVVYLPNAPYITMSNVSTFDMAHTNPERNAVIQNGYEVVTMGNSTHDENWPACVGCAILSRSFDRTGTDVPEICTQCFETYCWDGTLDSTAPASPYEPHIMGDEVDTSGAISSRVLSSALPALLAAAVAATVAVW